jgi:cytochrome b561
VTARAPRNGPDGYGLVTKTLHWLVAVAIAAQFVVGYLLDAEDGRGRGRGRGGESGRGRGRGGDLDPFGDDTLLTIHIVLGVSILVLASIRLVWRVTTPLPPWSQLLSIRERRFVHWLERVLYVLIFAIPASGRVLVLTDDDDLLGLHIATHLAFFVAISLHVGFALQHQLVARDGYVRRMS